MFSRLFRLGAPMTEKFLGHFYSRAKILVWYLASECMEFQNAYEITVGVFLS